MEVADQVGVYLEDGVGNGLPDGGEEGVGLPGGVLGGGARQGDRGPGEGRRLELRTDRSL